MFLILMLSMKCFFCFNVFHEIFVCFIGSHVDNNNNNKNFGICHVALLCWIYIHCKKIETAGQYQQQLNDFKKNYRKYYSDDEFAKAMNLLKNNLSDITFIQYFTKYYKENSNSFSETTILISEPMQNGLLKFVK